MENGRSPTGRVVYRGNSSSEQGHGHRQNPVVTAPLRLALSSQALGGRGTRFPSVRVPTPVPAGKDGRLIFGGGGLLPGTPAGQVPLMHAWPRLVSHRGRDRFPAPGKTSKAFIGVREKGAQPSISARGQGHQVTRVESSVPERRRASLPFPSHTAAHRSNSELDPSGWGSPQNNLENLGTLSLRGQTSGLP